MSGAIGGLNLRSQPYLENLTSNPTVYQLTSGSGTLTLGSKYSSLSFFIVGGGGGGSYGARGGDGGGGGANVYAINVPMSTATSLTYAVGSGGAGGNSTTATGGTGGTSSITFNGVTYSCSGGNSGAGGTYTQTGATPTGATVTSSAGGSPGRVVSESPGTAGAGGRIGPWATLVGEVQTLTWANFASGDSYTLFQSNRTSPTITFANHNLSATTSGSVRYALNQILGSGNWSTNLATSGTPSASGTYTVTFTGVLNGKDQVLLTAPTQTGMTITAAETTLASNTTTYGISNQGVSPNNTAWPSYGGEAGAPGFSGGGGGGGYGIGSGGGNVAQGYDGGDGAYGAGGGGAGSGNSGTGSGAGGTNSGAGGGGGGGAGGAYTPGIGGAGGSGYILILGYY